MIQKNEPDAKIESTEHQLFRQRVERYQRSIFSFLGRFGFQAAVAEELAQDTFLRAWRARDSVDLDKGAYSTWLFRIARNVALTELERNKRGIQQQGIEQPGIDAAEAVATPDTAVENAEFDQALTQLRAAVQELNAQEREAIALASVQELSIHEAAAVAGCREGAFRTRLSRARKRLLNKWNQYDEAN